jgi:hypothetical protein
MGPKWNLTTDTPQLLTEAFEYEIIIVLSNIVQGLNGQQAPYLFRNYLSEKLHNLDILCI